MPAALPRLILATAFGLTAAGVALGTATRAAAQDGARPQSQASQPDEEMTVIAPRRTVPDYQTFDEFQREEFEKIRGRFEKPPPTEPRGDAVLSTSVAKGPTEQSEVRKMMREAPRLRDLVD